MRNLSIKNYKYDKKYLIAVFITLLCAIISGIVLYIFADVNIYFKNFAEEYVFFVFNFKNGDLIFSHLLSELLFLYIFFLIGYCTKFKYLTLIFIFIRGLYFAVYTAILIELNAFGGITVAILVFIPTSVFSIIFCCITAETCKSINKKIVFFVPAVFAVFNTLILLLLINVVFRVVIVIV